MKPDRRPSDRDLAVLLKRARVIPPLPEAVKARIIARARAAAVAGEALASQRGS
jgi:hypothetical protein